LKFKSGAGAPQSKEPDGSEKKSRQQPVNLMAESIFAQQK